MLGFTAVAKRPVAGGTGRKWTGFLLARGSGFAVERSAGSHAGAALATAGGHGASVATTSRYARPPNGRYAVQFDGATGYIDVPDAASLRIAGDITIEAWISGIPDYSVPRGIASKTGSVNHNIPAPFDFYIQSGSGLPQLYRGNGTLYANVSATTKPSANAVHHIAVTMQGATVTHYLDGAPNGTGTLSTSIADQAQSLRIGMRADAATKMRGGIDGLRIYSRALSAAEIASRFAGSDVDPTGLVGWWTFNEGAGSTAQDSAGLANHGTLVGGASFGPGITFDGPYAGNSVGGARAAIITLGLHYTSGIASVTGSGFAASTTLPTKLSHLIAVVGGLAGCGGVPTYLGRPGSQHVPEDIRVTTDRAGNAVAILTQRPARPPVASELPASRAASSAPNRETSRMASGVPTSTMRRAE